jgi:hypothetical protein
MKKYLLLLTVVGLSACDVDAINTAFDGAPPVVETGRLTLVNLPEGTSAIRVVKVGDAGLCEDTEAVAIDGTSAVIPLVGPRGEKFDKTGTYSVSLVIEAYGTELLITGETALFAEFVNGRGTADLSGIEGEEAEPDYNLIILNLPERTDTDSFKTLQIGENAARCADFSTITVKGTTAYVPLINQKGERFNLTGSFYIGLNMEVDSLNIVSIAYREHYIARFTGGKGIFDIKNPGEQMVIGATLKIVNLPENTDTDSFKLLNVGGIAKCADFEQILIKSAEYEAQIPLVVNDGKDFDKSGTYYIVMRLIVDSLRSVEITEADYVTAEFSGGYGILDMENVYNNMKPGYLNGHLTNEGNYYEPRVAGGTMFELLGNYFRVVDDEAIKTTMTVQAMADGVVYVYAVPNEKFVINAGILHYTDSGYADFRYSVVTPVYNAGRAGWYNGNDRALWKFLKIGGEYRYKIRVGEDFTLEHDVINTTTGTLIRGFSGDIYPTEITLEPGFYCFEAAGAAGGPGDTDGGEGGRIIELVRINQTRKFWVYTGTKGKEKAAYGDYESLLIVGGGGGAGSYISDGVGVSKGYLLCAGGGGGGYVDFAGSWTWYGEEMGKRVGKTISAKIFVSGGCGGTGGSGGGGGWGGNNAAVDKAGVGGGVFGGVPYHSPDGTGLVKNAAGCESVIKEATPSSVHHYESNDSEVGYYSYDFIRPGFGGRVRASGGGSGVFSAANAGGRGGYITESGVVYAPASGGNNRNGSRGGNSGDGYVNIYKLQ